MLPFKGNIQTQWPLTQSLALARQDTQPRRARVDMAKAAEHARTGLPQTRKRKTTVMVSEVPRNSWVEKVRKHLTPPISLLTGTDFKKHPSKDFALGRVLKIFWFEPLGGNAMQNQHNGTINTRGSYVGEQLQQAMNQRGKIRRFVIIETRKGHSTAVYV